MTDTAEIVRRYWALANARAWDEFATLLAPAMRYEVPQTREFAEGAAAYLELFRTWPGDWRAEVDRVGAAAGVVQALDHGLERHAARSVRLRVKEELHHLRAVDGVPVRALHVLAAAVTHADGAARAHAVGAHVAGQVQELLAIDRAGRAGAVAGLAVHGRDGFDALAGALLELDGVQARARGGFAELSRAERPSYRRRLRVRYRFPWESP